MKKILCAALCLALLCGCAPAPAVRHEKPSIVTTIFPLYDWTRQLLGNQAGEVELTMLQGSGVDLHSYQPTVDDMVRLSQCDLFIYVGGESDDWVEDALQEAVNPRMRVINLMEVLGDAVREEETVPGMQADPDEPGGELEYDEHIWLSLNNAFTCCSFIAQTLEAMDVITRKDSQMDEYAGDLVDLYGAYLSAVQEASVKTLLFGDRFPFRYLTEELDLSCYAAFSGCSAETEASFETIVFLSGKVDELNLPAVLTIEGSDGKIARTIVENTVSKTAKVLTLDSMQSVTAEDVENGATYLGIMEQNLEVLREALQ